MRIKLSESIPVLSQVNANIPDVTAEKPAAPPTPLAASKAAAGQQPGSNYEGKLSQTLASGKSSELLRNSLSGVTTATEKYVKRFPLTEKSINKFIKNMTVKDQIAATKDLKNWIASNFRMDTAQKAALNALSENDLQRVQTAVARASELKTKLIIRLGNDGLGDAQSRDDKLQYEERSDSVILKHLQGCRPEMMDQLQESVRNKILTR